MNTYDENRALVCANEQLTAESTALRAEVERLNHLCVFRAGIIDRQEPRCVEANQRAERAEARAIRAEAECERLSNWPTGALHEILAKAGCVSVRETDYTALKARAERAEKECERLREMTRERREVAESLLKQRDQWRECAERLASVLKCEGSDGDIDAISVEYDNAQHDAALATFEALRKGEL